MCPQTTIDVYYYMCILILLQMRTTIYVFHTTVYVYTTYLTCKSMPIGTHFACFTSTKVQILTQEQQMCHLQPLSVHPGRTVRAVTLSCPLRTMRQVYSVDLLY